MKNERENELIAGGSALLAQFMNLTEGRSHNANGLKIWVSTITGEVEHSGELKYHQSWDWIIPVVQRIKNRTSVEDFNYHVTLMTEYRDRKATVMELKVTQDILVVFLRCVEFVKWYSSSVGAINSFSHARK